MKSVIDELIEAMVQRKLASREEVQGCNDSQVEQVRATAGGSIPPLYEELGTLSDYFGRAVRDTLTRPAG